MKMTHTSGPWMHLSQGDIVSKSAPTCSADGYTDVAAVYMTSNDAGSANAKLIAAAPDLLATLKSIANCNMSNWSEEFRNGDDFRIWAQTRARVAITQAVGVLP